MRQMLFLFGIVLTLLATSLHVEAAAYPGETHSTAESQASDANHDQESGGGKGQGCACICHHHCSNAATPSTDSVLESISWSMPIFSEGMHRALSSRSDDPLLEPPSA